MDKQPDTTLDQLADAAKPSEAMIALERLVGDWTVEGGVSGTVRYEWLPGRHFLIQHVEFEHLGQLINGLEVIGHLRPFGGDRSDEIASRFYDADGNTFDYVYELDKDELTIWERHRGSDSRFHGTFSADGNTLTGAWVYQNGGGYPSIMTRK